jgi:putative transposase
MSPPDRRAMLDRADKALSLRRQCAPVGVARSGVYRAREPANDNDAALMRRIDELFTVWPFLGSRRITAMLRAEGVSVNRKRVQRLMRLMGIAALGPSRKRAKARPATRSTLSLAPRDDRARDGRPTSPTFRLGAAFSISWRSSTGRRARCLRGGCRTRWTFRSACRRSRRLWRSSASRRFSTPTGLAVHLGRLHRHARRSRRHDLHGRARPLDGQRVHRAAVAVAEVRGRLSQGYADGREAARGIAEWIAFYNDRRPHQALADRMPMVVWREGATGAKAVDIVDNASAMPTGATADAASRCVIERNDDRSLQTKKPPQAVPLRGSTSVFGDPKMTGAPRSPHSPLPHSRNRKRQLPLQGQLRECRQTHQGEISELDERLTPKPSSSWVSSQWKSRVKSRRKSTAGCTSPVVTLGLEPSKTGRNRAGSMSREP